MHINKKAFTMVELLATITILGILMTVSITAVSKIIERAKKEYYSSQEKNIILAAQSYVQNNRNKLPKGIGQQNKISLSTLFNNKYLKEIVKDYNKNNCYMNESYVNVFKYSQKDYSYLVYLKCPNYNSNEQINKIKPNISIVMSGSSVKDAKAKITIKGSGTGKEKLMGYSYTIYRENKSSWEEKINSGSLSGNQATSKVMTFSLSEYVPGNIKIQVTATNIYGINASQTLTHNFEDNAGPKCVYIKEEDKSSNVKEWTNKDRKITIGCDDGDGVGCTRATYTKTFTSDTKIGSISIKDKSGNSVTCQVSVYVDKTAPSIPSITNNNDHYNANNWAKGPFKLKLKSSDKLSGLEKYEFSYNMVNWNSYTNFNNNSFETSLFEEEGKRNFYIRTVDRAGNYSDILSTSINIDKTAPSIKVGLYARNDDGTKKGGVIETFENKAVKLNDSYGNNGWMNKSSPGGVYYEEIYTDNTSGLATREWRYNTPGLKKGASGVDTLLDNKMESKTLSGTTATDTTKISSEGYRLAELKVCDKAGNCKTINFTAKIDRTAPTCSITKTKVGTADGVTVKITCSGGDKYSNVNCPSNESNVTKTKTYEVTDKAGNKNECKVNVTSEKKCYDNYYYADLYCPSGYTLSGSSCSMSIHTHGYNASAECNEMTKFNGSCDCAGAHGKDDNGDDDCWGTVWTAATKGQKYCHNNMYYNIYK